MALTQAGLGGSSWPWWFKLALVVQDGLGVVQAGLGGGVMRGTCDG